MWCIIASFRGGLADVSVDAFSQPMLWLDFLLSPFGGLRCLGVARVFPVEVTVVKLALLFPEGGLLGAWLPCGEVVLNFVVDFRVQCEFDFSSFNAVSFLVYRDANPGVFGYPEFGSSLFLLVVCYGASIVLAHLSACGFLLVSLLILTVKGFLVVSGALVCLFFFFFLRCPSLFQLVPSSLMRCQG